MAANGYDDDQTRSFTALVAGTKVSHYKIISKIGAGGMGEVYLAEDTQLDRKVALKFLPSHLAQDDAARARFTREARAAAKLDHPNIVQVFEVGEFQGRPFFAMALIEGKSLREIIKESKLSINDAIEFTKQICEGLHKAHESGVVHRDVKPGNIIVDSDNNARILDFGLATVAGEEKLTKTGSTLGTVGYMSPEQIEGKKVDHRGDLFSVGVILYEMLTGRRPFEGDTDAAVARSITDTRPEPIARYKSGTTGELQRIVDKALQKDPALRYQHADGILADLKRLELGGMTSRKNRLGVWAAFAAVLIVAGWFAADRLFLSPKGKAGKWSKSIAVLVFRDQSQAQDQGFFCEGMTDAIIGRLSGISDLKVISLTSVLRYATTEPDLKKIGHDLGVETILEGSIMRSGDRIRIRAQLIDVDEDAHLWSDQYDRKVESLFDVQDEISKSIVDAMRVELVGDAESILVKRSTSNLEAYMEYTQGRHFWRKRTTEGLVKSVEHFQSAIELDSSYALAYSGLADAYYILPRYTNVKYPEVKQKQLEAARTAVRLDDNSAEAHTSMAAYMKLIGDIDSAEVEFKRAIELSPCYSWAHLWYGNLLDESRNDPEGSESETRAALECDPLSIVALNNLAARESWKGNYDEAERLYNRIWEVEPTNSGLRINATSHYIRVGKLDEANSLFMKATELEPTTWWIYRLYADYLFHFGHRDKADSVYWNVIKVYPDQPVNYVNYGRFLKDSIQEYEGAIEQFRKAISLRPDDSPTYNQLAYSYYKIGKTDSALWAVNEAVELDTNCAECYQTKGVIYSELGILDSSLVAFRRSLEITPQWTTSMIGMGRAALLAGRWELADSLAEADANQDKAAHYRAFGRQRQALALAARGRFRESIQLFHENARADSIEFGNEWSLEEENARWFWYWNLLDIYKYYVRDPAAIEIAAAFRAFSVNSQWAAEGRPQWIPTSAGNLAYIYARVGEFDQAKMWLDTMRLDTDSSDSRGGRRLHFYHGAVALEQGEYDTAIAHLKIYGYTHMRGMAYLGAGQVKEAVKQFEWAVNHRATYRTSGWEIAISWCYYGLGRAYEADGQIEKAIAQYEIFLDLWKDADEDLKSVIDAKTRLERLKS